MTWCERGAAIVEFALVAPLFILFSGAVVSFGAAYSARYQLAVDVDNAVRICVANNQGTSATCADSYFKGFYAKANGTPPYCSDLPITTSTLLPATQVTGGHIKPGPGPAGGFAGPPSGGGGAQPATIGTSTLTVAATCNIAWSSLMKVISGFSGTFRISAQAVKPF